MRVYLSIRHVRETPDISLIEAATVSKVAGHQRSLKPAPPAPAPMTRARVSREGPGVDVRAREPQGHQRVQLEQDRNSAPHALAGQRRRTPQRYDDDGDATMSDAAPGPVRDEPARAPAPSRRRAGGGADATAARAGRARTRRRRPRPRNPHHPLLGPRAAAGT